MTNTPITCRNIYAGTWHDGSGGVIDRANPATGELAAVAPRSTADDVDAAVKSAVEAFRTWRKTRPAERAKYLHQLADECAQRVDDMASAITREQGKPLNEARGEVQKFVTALHYYAEEATRVFGRTIPNDAGGFLSIVEKEPIGPVAGIAPWNYPIELIGWKLAGATAAGCTIVIKPSEHTPGCAQVLSECVAAVLPAGVVNFVYGDGSTGQALVAHPAIAKVGFTGPVATGQSIMRSVTGITALSLELGGSCPMIVTKHADVEAAAKVCTSQSVMLSLTRITAVSLELGGSCPMIVTKHADVEAAVKGATRRSFRNAGQICIAINRIYAHRDVYVEFVNGLAAAADALVVADGIKDPAADR